MEDDQQPDNPGEITSLLHQWEAGDHAAMNQLATLLDTTLKGIAHNRNKAFPGWWDTTELLDEAFVSLLSGKVVPLESRKHFFNLISNVIYHILIDEVRKQKARRHGHGLNREDLDENQIKVDNKLEMIIAVHEAMTMLKKEDPTTADVVIQRFFFGYSIEKTAEQLEIPIIQVNRRWKFAKAWLFDHLSDSLKNSLRTELSSRD